MAVNSNVMKPRRNPPAHGASANPYVSVDPGFEATYPGADALSSELAINLFVLNGRVSAFADALSEKHGVPSPAAFNVLTILDGAMVPMPPSTIAKRMLVSRPTMTGIVASLVKRRLVRVLDHPTDGRMTLVELTGGGRRVVRRMRPELHAAERRWMSCLTRHEQHLLTGILAKLQVNAPRVDRP